MLFLVSRNELELGGLIGKRLRVRPLPKRTQVPTVECDYFEVELRLEGEV